MPHPLATLQLRYPTLASPSASAGDVQDRIAIKAAAESKRIPGIFSLTPPNRSVSNCDARGLHCRHGFARMKPTGNRTVIAIR